MRRGGDVTFFKKTEMNVTNDRVNSVSYKLRMSRGFKEKFYSRSLRKTEKSQ